MSLENNVRYFVDPHVKLLAYSQCGQNTFLTYKILFPKVLLAQLNKHRVFANSVSSSRAVKMQDRRDYVRNNAFYPIFTKEQPGMSAVPFSEEELEAAEGIYETWQTIIECSLVASEELEQLGVHKQNTNRVLDTYTWCDVVLSGTDFDNFFELRTKEDSADLDFCKIAQQMQFLKENTDPTVIDIGQAHIPKIANVDENLKDIRIIIARLARTSFGKTDANFTSEQDISLFYRLLKNKHASPFEHVALAVNDFPLEAGILYNDKMYSVPKPLQNKLAFFNGDIVSTRQYSGFYTVRAMLEDGYSFEEIQVLFNENI